MTTTTTNQQPLHATWICFLVALAGLVLFGHSLGRCHLFDWDEINFAECAREMLVTDDWLRVQLDYKPFWEKPPLFIWLQAASMKVFGVGEAAARFPNALVGVATLLCLLYAGTRVRNRATGLAWVVVYAASWLPHFYFKSGIIDPLFNLFIFLAFFQTWLVMNTDRAKTKHAALAGIFLGLAVLTKGPVAILVAVLALGVHAVLRLGLGGITLASILTTTVAAAAVTALWFGAEVAAHGWWFLQEFITYQIRLLRTEDAGHGGPFFYHFIVLLVGCFPASIFLFERSAGRDERLAGRGFRRWMWIMFWVVLILFSLVKTKIVHYSSLCYFPLTFLAAERIAVLWETRRAPGKPVLVLLAVIGGLLAVAIGALPLVGLHKEALIPYIKDPFAVANLAAPVAWSYAECAWGALYLGGIIAALALFRRRPRAAMLMLAAVQIAIIQVAVTHFTPKIEGYSQRAAVTFFERLQGKDVYVRVLGYKSYAPFFYARTQPPSSTDLLHEHRLLYNHAQNLNMRRTAETYWEHWLLHGAVDKPTYFVAKTTAAEPYRALPQLEVISEEAGFVFFRRKL